MIILILLFLGDPVLGSVCVGRGSDIRGHGGHDHRDRRLLDSGRQRSFADGREPELEPGLSGRFVQRRSVVRRSVHAGSRAAPEHPEPGAADETGPGQAQPVAAQRQRRGQRRGDHDVPVRRRPSGQRTAVQRQAADVRRAVKSGREERRERREVAGAGRRVRQEGAADARRRRRPAGGVRRLVRRGAREVRRRRKAGQVAQEERRAAGKEETADAQSLGRRQ